MKITVFNGSPRKEKGNTHMIAKSFLKGVKKAGANYENIFLAEKEIGICEGCFACWSKLNGKCIKEDDMGELIEKYMNSDIVCFATPLYTDSVTSLTKKFMERLIPFLNPKFTIDKSETRHVLRYDKYPDYVIISNCGYPEYSQFQVLSLLFKRFAKETNVDVKLEILRTEGELLRTKSSKLKNVIEKYLLSVEKAGYQLIKNGKVEEDLLNYFKNPLVDETFYKEKANNYWDRKFGNI